MPLVTQSAYSRATAGSQCRLTAYARARSHLLVSVSSMPVNLSPNRTSVKLGNDDSHKLDVAGCNQPAAHGRRAAVPAGRVGGQPGRARPRGAGAWPVGPQPLSRRLDARGVA